MTRIVVDPGVLISAAIGGIGNPPDLILTAIRDGGIQLLASPQLLAELVGVLERPKSSVHVGKGRVEGLIGQVASSANLYTDPTPSAESLTGDPKDDYLVALARVAQADFLVSGDAHLTGLEDPNPPILTPRELVERLGLG